MRRCLLLVLVLVSSFAAPAEAQVTGANTGSGSGGHLAFVTQGNDTRSTLRIVSPDGQVGPAETITDGDDTPVVALGARGDAIVAWRDDDHRLWTRYRPVGGPLGPAELVASDASDLLEALPIALDASGGAIVAWAPERGPSALRVRFRDPAAGWGPPQPLGGIDVYRPRLALADNGSAVIAWSQRVRRNHDPSELAVSSRAPGTPFGPVQVIRRDTGSVRVATNARGDAVVAWIELHGRNLSVHGAFRPAGGGAFGRPVALSRVTDASGPSVAVQPSGRMILAWRANESHRVEARVRSSTGVLGQPRILTHDFSLNATPEVLTAGRGVVAWTDDIRGKPVLRVAQATDDRRFEPAQTVARIRDASLDPALAPVPGGVTVVAGPPFAPDDAIDWQRLTLGE